MIFGIDCSRYALPKPTGVEHYTDRVVEGIVHQADHLGYDEVRLYVKNATQVERLLDVIDDYGQKNVEVVLIEQRRLWTIFGLGAELKRNTIDTLFVPSHILPLSLPKRAFLTVHGLEALLFPSAYTLFQRFYQRFALWWAKRKGAELIAVSKAVKKDIVRFFAVPEERIHVVYNGFDSAQEEGSKKRDKKEIELVSGDFVLSVGRLEERKNQKRLVQAFDLIAEDFPDLKLVLIGPDGKGAGEVRRQVEQSTHKERILVPGYQHTETVRYLMRKAKVFAYPSLAEGFGIPVLEAFDAETPLLTSKGSATQEIAGKAAVLCDPLSVESIADGLRQLLKDRSLRKQLRELGQERLQQFSWEKCAREVIELVKAQPET